MKPSSLLQALAGVVLQIAVFSAVAVAAPPTITLDPTTVVATAGTSARFEVGATARFEVGATAAAPLSYQWRHLGTPLENATGPTLTLSNVTMADAGLYDVVVTAGGESTVSQAGRLITTPTRYADEFCLDDSFLPLIETTGASAQTVAADPITGGFYVGGEFSTIDGARRWNLARFDATGKIDATFAPQIDGKVLTIAVQPDGKVLLGGAFCFVNNVQRGGIARLNTDGSLDRTFGNNRGFAGTVTCIGLQSTGRIVVCGPGSFDGLAAFQYTTVLRLLPDGRADSTFSAAATPSSGCFAIDNQDRILFPGQWSAGTFVRLLLDGAKDATFNAPADLSEIHSFAIQSDGQPVITAGSSIVRLLNDGSRDTTFSPRVRLAGASLYPPPVAIDAAGRIYVYTNFDFALVRLLPNGTTDTSFTAPGYLNRSTIMRGVAALSSGRVVAVGDDDKCVRTFNADGSLSSACGAFFKPSLAVHAALPIKNGGWLIGGGFSRVNGLPRAGIARLTATGTADPTFTPPAAEGAVTVIARQPDGKILLSRSMGGRAVERLLPDGAPDASFAIDWYNAPAALALQADGKVVVGGDGWLVRFCSDGAPDATFAATIARPFSIGALTIQPDGKILTCGSSPVGSSGTSERYLARLLYDGAADPAFAADNDAVDWSLEAMALLPNGEIVLNGSVRLHPDGSLAYMPEQDDWTGTVRAQFPMPDGRTVIAGGLLARIPSAEFESYWALPLLRLRTDGMVDQSFQLRNIDSFDTPAAVFDDSGRLLLTGSSGNRCGVTQTGFIRLRAASAPEPTIIQSPTGGHVRLGEGATLKVNASGVDLHYSWYKDGDVLPGADSATLSISAATAADSGRYHVEVSNAYGTVMSAGADFIASSEAEIEYYEWAAANGLSDPHDRNQAPDRDPEGDGVLNLLHYAFKTPRGSGRGTNVHVVTEHLGGSDFLAVQFTRKTYATDLHYIVEASSDLLNWEEVETVHPGSPELVTICDTLPIGSTSRRFMRVRPVLTR
ncbi:MAG TPA: immunoglobulin domain-containing protein [Opitutaceae bacterium]|nr:immunoglobulin domain-containing protein [Opitutaceae bacterium]